MDFETAKKRAQTRSQGKIMGTQDGEFGRRPRSFPSVDAQEGYDEGYARGRAYAVKHKGARLNPGMSAWEWLGLGTLSAIVLYAIFKPGNAEGSIVPATGGQTPTHPTSHHPVVVTTAPIAANLVARPDADAEFIRGIQDRLRQIGYQPGPSTGVLNHDTNYAIAFFQRAEGLPATGILTGTTATRLAAVFERKLQQRVDRELALVEEIRFWTLFGPLSRVWRVAMTGEVFGGSTSVTPFGGLL